MTRAFLLAEAEPVKADRLLAIADELRAIASTLEEPGELSGARLQGQPDRADLVRTDLVRAGPYGARSDKVGLARHIYAMRRRRAALLPDSGLFAEPAWDMLLDLYVAHADGKRLSVTDACIGAAVPVTTALRWLERLEAAGLLCRENDCRDGRRSYVAITPAARAALDDWLAQFAALPVSSTVCA